MGNYYTFLESIMLSKDIEKVQFDLQKDGFSLLEGYLSNSQEIKDLQN